MVKEVNKYFEEEYDTLVEYATRMYRRENKDEDPYALISGCYEYIIKNIDKIKSNSDIRKFVSTFIYHNTRWYNGFTENLKGVTRDRTTYYNARLGEDVVDEEYIDDTELKYQAILNVYKKSGNLEERAIWELYFEKGWNTAKVFSEMTGVSIASAFNYLRELKERIREEYERLDCLD